MNSFNIIKNIFEDETKGAILWIISIYGSLNLEKLYKMIGKPKSTVLDHLSALKKQGLIELDSEKTANRRGKYYQSTKKAQDLLKNYSELDKLSSKEYPLILSKILRSIGITTQIFTNMHANFIENNSHLITDEATLKAKFRDLSQTELFFVSISSSEELKELEKIRLEYTKKITDFIHKPRGKTIDTMFLLNYGCPMNRVGK